MTIRVVASMIVLALLGIVSPGAAQEKVVTASAAWIAEPAAGATTASAYLEIDNPTMYDVYVVSATSDAAGSVAFGEAVSATESKATREMTVPAFGAIALKPDGLHLVLKDLTRPLKKGDSVTLTLKTDGGVTLKVDATVR